MQVAFYYDKRLKSRIEKILDENDYSLVLPHLIRVSKNIIRKDVPIFLEMTDAISMNYFKFRDFPNAFLGVKNFLFALDAKKTLNFEQKCIRDFDHTFLISEIDKQFILKSDSLVRSKVTVAPNGCDFDKKENSGKDSLNKKNEIIFMGFIRSRQNFDAARYFIKNVMPILKKAGYNFQFKIVGEISNSYLKKLNKFEDVLVTGRVNSFSRHFANGFVGVCPMRLGAGQQNKILEYIKHNLPVITSRIGLEGSNLRESEHVVVADSPQEFAHQIIRIFNDKDLSYKITEQAYDYVYENMSWEKSLNPLINYINTNIN